MKQNGRKTTAAVAAGLAAALACGGCATVYRVNGNAADAGSDRFAAGVASEVRGELLDGGRRVLGPGQKPGWFRPVVDVDLTASKRKDAQLDQWKSYEGKVKASVQEGKGGLLGEKTFTAKSPRTRDEEAAESAMQETLSRQIGAWVKKISE